MIHRTYAAVAVLCKSKTYAASRTFHQDVIKAVEASLHIKGGIYQSSCFSKTIVTTLRSQIPTE